MSINLESTTDSKEAVTAALGDLASPVEIKDEVVEENLSATAEETPVVENKDDSETSEEEEIEAKESDEGEEEEQLNAGPKKKGGFQRRIDKLTGKLSAKDQEVEYWRQEALKHQKPVNADGEQTPKLNAGDGKPNKNDFENVEDYYEALTDWKVEQKLLAEEVKQKEVAVKTEYKKQIDTHLGRVEAFKSKHEDFGELLESVDDVPMSITVQDVIIRSENGPDLMYELAKNRSEFERINKLSAIDAARELGRIEARLAKVETPKKTETKTTKAPNPITPVNAKTSGAVKKSIYDESLSQREYEKLREEQLKGQNA